MLSSDEDAAAEIAGQQRDLDAARAGLLQRRQWSDTGELLANVEAWCIVWRGNLGEADCGTEALRRKIVTALAMAVFTYPDGNEPRWRGCTDWNATMVGDDPAMVVADTTSA